MAKPKNNRRHHYSVSAAIALHADANKSDPFAAKRIAMTLAKHPKDTKHVAEEGRRLCEFRSDRIRRNGAADWVSPEQHFALTTLRNDMRNAQANKPKRKHGAHLSMSMFVSKADLEAARAA